MTVVRPAREGDVRPVHVFVDESIRPDGFYRLTAVTVRSVDLASLAKTIRSGVHAGSHRVHFSSEGDKRRRAILRVYANLDVGVTVIRTPHLRRVDDQPARERCITAMLGGPDAEIPTAVVLDTRGPDRDHLDRVLIRRLAVSRSLDRLTYVHRGSRDELLLALPDAFGWAAGPGGPWRKLIAPVATLIDVDETG